jgi:hypothetical protein
LPVVTEVLVGNRVHVLGFATGLRHITEIGGGVRNPV